MADERSIMTEMSLNWETSRNDRPGIFSHKKCDGIICVHIHAPEDKRADSGSGRALRLKTIKARETRAFQGI
jgi:hypothetical protein